VLVGKTEVNKVYDPACGSGSLLLRFAKLLGKDHVRQGFYGQEINPTTYNLCRINMFLHDINYDQFHIALEDTLIHPQLEEYSPFDAIVSNPPYSIHWIGSDDPTLINDERFSPAAVLAPKGKADMAFIMHSLSWLSTDGTAAIVCFPGIMYRGGAEKQIRKYLIKENKVDCIIQLPDNLFFGTTIATCIMVLKKSKTDTNVLFIDASKEYEKATNNNLLSESNISNIVKEYENKKAIDHVCALVSDDSIINEHDCNLSVSTYVQPEEKKTGIDIDALNLSIEGIVAKENSLRTQIDQIIDGLERVSK